MEKGKMSINGKMNKIAAGLVAQFVTPAGYVHHYNMNQALDSWSKKDPMKNRKSYVKDGKVDIDPNNLYPGLWSRGKE